MKDFAAIDFETADECRSGVCSVAVVIPGYYSYWNTQVYGLTEDSTMAVPTLYLS